MLNELQQRVRTAAPMPAPAPVSNTAAQKPAAPGRVSVAGIEPATSCCGSKSFTPFEEFFTPAYGTQPIRRMPPAPMAASRQSDWAFGYTSLFAEAGSGGYNS